MNPLQLYIDEHVDVLLFALNFYFISRDNLPCGIVAIRNPQQARSTPYTFHRCQLHPKGNWEYFSERYVRSLQVLPVQYLNLIFD